MGNETPIQIVPSALKGQGQPQRRKAFIPVAFHRRELDSILRVYGRMVAAGEWRDYALDMGGDVAVFAVFRHSGEVPLYRIEKDPKLARRQGAYRVVAASGQILKRGHDLVQVLKVFDRKSHLRVVE
ncbi:DUF2794 domain-containing protein [Polycladidibacter stylochi]|uniref:DUF2794 domain-containing protein n=1 Tax=Polycladidibacter stylochi TaxID=1807766 RepID=UPI0008295C2A|nr:DUF2794 domain-containing protein [Pseudovibrio stylochi]